eukprot:1140381-Pelagomonas_calceolata.AAC.10
MLDMKTKRAACVYAKTPKLGNKAELVCMKRWWGSLFYFAARSCTHHEILPVRRREHISCGERPPGDVCNGRGHVVHPGHQPHKGHSLGKSCDFKLLPHSEGCGSLNRAAQRITSWGRSRNMYLGRL